ncbi:hypothetical protein ACOBQX_24120 [Actinokineospora sp. G85]|uniref:hypothetical protein n=1 Tax=Actinokineospora sp. G85 TaxID=3406626 RepID=UPI003C728327
MALVAEHRAVLGVDIVGSARLPGKHTAVARRIALETVEAALAERAVEVLHRSDTGDGALITVPGARVADLLDAAHAIDAALVEHNTWHRPEVRLRLSVESGPIGDTPDLYLPRKDAARLLDAEDFKRLLTRSLDPADESRATTGLIVSDHVLRAAFAGDHTTRVRRAEFTPLPVRNKEFTTTAWVRIPGVDVKSLATPPTPQQPPPTITNNVGGDMHGIQTHTVNGNITLGGPR